MSYILDEILSAEREHALGVRLLEAAARDQLRARVFSRYGANSNRLWETASDRASVQNSEGWQWVREFVGSRSCVLFFDLSDETEMFCVPSGAALHELLAETCGFVFYVTDPEASYLICFNDHDFLVYCGGAREWLERRSQKRVC